MVATNTIRAASTDERMETWAPTKTQGTNRAPIASTVQLGIRRLRISLMLTITRRIDNKRRTNQRSISTAAGGMSFFSPLPLGQGLSHFQIGGGETIIAV